jgi:hypothetical protein
MDTGAEKRPVKATVFRAASMERYKDAECLHVAGRFQGAIYLCGYALECELKRRVCVARGIASMEEREAKRLGHELPELLDAACMAKLLSGNRDLLVAFQAIVGRWSTDLRYSGGGSSRKDSDRFLRDSWMLLSWLRTQSES